MPNATAFTTPTVHMNGTGFKTLNEDMEKIDDAFFLFINTWERVEFNARDYYVQGPEAFTQARDERLAINVKIRDIKRYIDAHRIAIDKQRPPTRP